MARHAGACYSHVKYDLSCDELEALEARTGGRCERCGIVPAKFVIDHDHGIGPSAVRGLICHKCNSAMIYVDRGWRLTDVDAAYLEKAWHALQPDRSGTVLRVIRVDVSTRDPDSAVPKRPESD